MCDIESKENILKAAEYCVQNSVCSGCVLRTDYQCKERLAEYLLALKIENTNLFVENEVLKRDRDNLQRTVEEGNEELADAKKEILYEVWDKLQDLQAKGYYDGLCECDLREIAKEYGVEL
jgi:hypothetical protein